MLDANAPPLGRDHRVFCADLSARLGAGSHLILYGPRGSGKSTLIKVIRNHYQAIGTPCGLAPQTSGLPDIIAALRQAYPDTRIDGIGKRAARARLRLAADHTSGVLLLDHATAMTTAMLGYLRRLRGGIAGALLVTDIDTSHERDRMRAWRAGALSIRIPRTPNHELRALLAEAIRSRNESAIPVEPHSVRQILRAARGRIGWLHECIRRLQGSDYWREDRLHASVLCTDTEIALRESRCGPRMRRFEVA